MMVSDIRASLHRSRDTNGTEDDKGILMIEDSKAESLEARGLYRRAAARWSEVMRLCADDKEREQARRRCDECLDKAKRPPAKQVVFADLREAAKETQKRMGLDRPNGEAFRDYKR